MRNSLDELKQGLKLLKLEWQEDLAQYKKKFLHTSVADKKKEGITWHPILLKKTKIGMGERLIIEVVWCALEAITTSRRAMRSASAPQDPMRMAVRTP